MERPRSSSISTSVNLEHARKPPSILAWDTPYTQCASNWLTIPLMPQNTSNPATSLADSNPILPGSDPANAIPALLARYGPKLHAVAQRLCSHRADAQDLVQDVFLQAFRKWHTFRGQSDPGTWLYTIAARTCKSRHRRKGGVDRRMPAVSQLMPWRETTITELATSKNQDDSAQRNEAIARIRQEISNLPEHLRVPLLMKEVLGVNVLDVATSLGLTENTVKTRLHRARLVLRKAMIAKAVSIPAPAPIFDKNVCIDLLKAKMDALDRGGNAAGFKVPKADLCDRCRAVFREFDLVQDACSQITADALPASLRSAILKEISLRESAQHAAPAPRRGRRPVKKSAALRY